MSLRVPSAKAIGAPKWHSRKECVAAKRPTNQRTQQTEGRIDRSILATLSARRAFREDAAASRVTPVDASEEVGWNVDRATPSKR